MATDKKTIFFDIDGTLINEKKEVPVSTVDTLQKLKDAGHHIFICTGRTKCMLPKVVTDLEFDGYVYGCGTGLEYEKKNLHLKELSYEQVLYLTDMLKRYNISYVYEGHKNVFLERELLNDERSYYKNFIRQLGDICISFDDYKEVHASKITCIYPPNMLVDDRDAFEKALEDEYELICHERVDNGIMTDGLVEIMPKGYTKGTGIQSMVERLGMDLDDTVGVGDSNNDLEMLKIVDTAICMGQGSSQAQELADFVTKGVNEDGIEYAMKTLGYI